MKKYICLLFFLFGYVCNAQVWYVDKDCDGFPTTEVWNASMPSSYCKVAFIPNFEECDDDNPNIPVTYYDDQDGDGFGTSVIGYTCGPAEPGIATKGGDCDDTNAAINSTTKWWVDNNNDNIYTPGVDSLIISGCERCPNCFLLSESGVAISEAAQDKASNWKQQDLFDFNGNIRTATRTYFDDFGSPTEVLSKDYLNDKVWGKEMIYDNFRRVVHSSFNAPSPLKNLSRISFLSTPTSISQGTTNLQDYYSDNNIDEQYQATATQPYLETIFDKLNPGKVINVLGGNQVDGQWKVGNNYTVPAAQEMYYAYGYDYFEGKIDNATNKEEIITKYFKVVNVNANGIETVQFIDGEGKLLATARSGGEVAYQVFSLIGTQGFVDVHIPAGIGSNLISLIGQISLYKVYNLKTGLEITPLTNSSLIGGNAYRIVAITPPATDPKTYVTNDSSGIISFDSDALGIKYHVNYYDFSLNVYDKTGRLTKNIQPAGFTSSTNVKAVPGYMASNATDYITKYWYNTAGQIIKIDSPDQGISEFIYRKDGKIRYSKNANASTKFSYTNYDTYGRPIENGVVTMNVRGLWGQVMSYDPDGVLNATAAQRSEQVFTIYDFPTNQDVDAVQLPVSPIDLTLNGVLTAAGISTINYKQKNLSGNVAITFKKDSQTLPINAITWYSYDIYGRVDWIVQYNDGIGAKTIHYEYDVNGNLRKALYNKDKNDERFVHQYKYNLNNVLTRVETSNDNTLFTSQVQYTYYQTGELKRQYLVQVGQGIDYVYTLGGMLKSINHPSLEQSKDPGGDANDVFGITLDYYDGDYNRLNSNITTFESVPSINENNYNGNIKASRWANRAMDLDGSEISQRAYLYEYNKNNWLMNAIFADIDSNNNINVSNRYREGGLSYNSNGNIEELVRSDNDGLVTDDLKYNYVAGKNQLNFIEELSPFTTDPSDIENQSNDNYQYDNIGRIIKNQLERIGYNYNTRGLVTSVMNLDTNFPIVKFEYNERGHRIKKESYKSLSGSLISTTYYVLDVAGNLMSSYYQTNSTPIQTDLPIYGAGRIGIYNRSTGVSNYEITDHLGNVRAVICKPTSTVEVVSYADYYPFGEKLPERNANDANYRFSFQGQELDPETGMEAFQLRLWDGRIGRWLSPDPYAQYDSPYLGMGNNPISSIDPDGGWETRFGRALGWVLSGFGGSFYDDPSAKNPNHRYGLRRSGPTSDGGMYMWTKFGGKGHDHYDYGFQEANSLIWNSSYMRDKINDQYTIGITGSYAYLLGVNHSYNITFLTRGEPGVYFTPSAGSSLGNGVEVSGSITASYGNFTLDPRDIRSSMLAGESYGVSAGFGVGTVGSIGASYAPVNAKRQFAEGGFINYSAGVGIGLDVGATGVSGQLNAQKTFRAVPLIKLKL